jgi:hypothetical protein
MNKKISDPKSDTSVFIYGVTYGFHPSVQLEITTHPHLTYFLQYVVKKPNYYVFASKIFLLQF